jgi:hypothetical protein
MSILKMTFMFPVLQPHNTLVYELFSVIIFESHVSHFTRADRYEKLIIILCVHLML